MSEKQPTELSQVQAYLRREGGFATYDAAHHDLETTIALWSVAAVKFSSSIDTLIGRDYKLHPVPRAMQEAVTRLSEHIAENPELVVAPAPLRMDVVIGEMARALHQAEKIKNFTRAEVTLSRMTKGILAKHGIYPAKSGIDLREAIDTAEEDTNTPEEGMNANKAPRWKEAAAQVTSEEAFALFNAPARQPDEPLHAAGERLAEASHRIYHYIQQLHSEGFEICPPDLESVAVLCRAMEACYASELITGRMVEAMHLALQAVLQGHLDNYATWKAGHEDVAESKMKEVSSVIKRALQPTPSEHGNMHVLRLLARGKDPDLSRSGLL